VSYRGKHIHPKIRGLKKKKRFFQNPIFWWLMLFAILIFGAVYVLLFMPSFQVEKINILGNEKIKNHDLEAITTKDINKKIFGIFYKSIFMVNPSLITKHLLAALPGVENAAVQKSLPQTITVRIKERVAYATFCQQENTCFLIDANGIIFEPLEHTADGQMVIKVSSDATFLLGQQAVAKDIMDSIVKIQENLKNNAKVDSSKVLVGNPLVVTTGESWRIYFNPASDIDLQITKMNLLLNGEIPVATRTKLQYIYLQYKDRVYYK